MGPISIWVLFVVIGVVAGAFVARGLRLLTDPEYRDTYLRRIRRDNERLAHILPHIADWARSTDIWGLRASGPGS